MVIDASALVAIFVGEPERDAFEQAVTQAKIRQLPATCLFGSRMVPATRRDEHSINDLDLWLHKARVEIVPGDANLVEVPAQAWLTYGRGRSPAAETRDARFPTQVRRALDDRRSESSNEEVGAIFRRRRRAAQAASSTRDNNQ